MSIFPVFFVVFVFVVFLPGAKMRHPTAAAGQGGIQEGDSVDGGSDGPKEFLDSMGKKMARLLDTNAGDNGESAGENGRRRLLHFRHRRQAGIAAPADKAANKREEYGPDQQQQMSTQRILCRLSDGLIYRLSDESCRHLHGIPLDRSPLTTGPPQIVANKFAKEKLEEHRVMYGQCVQIVDMYLKKMAASTTKEETFDIWRLMMNNVVDENGFCMWAQAKLNRAIGAAIVTADEETLGKIRELQRIQKKANEQRTEQASNALAKWAN